MKRHIRKIKDTLYPIVVIGCILLAVIESAMALIELYRSGYLVHVPLIMLVVILGFKLWIESAKERLK